MHRLLISAAHKSSGKTMVTVGLCAALAARGQVVQAFKKGPDYIDPMWLRQASGRDCYNLDPFLMTHRQISGLFARHAAPADISIVEGNKGLYDGLALDGSNSNAALAQMLGLPVLLVIDARGMTRGIAPLLLGYQAFDRSIRIAGVILNQLGGARHESKLRAVIEHYTDLPVLGAIAHDPRLAVVERHLGLMPSRELDDAAQRVRAIGALVAAQVDLSRVLEVAASAAHTPAMDPPAAGDKHVSVRAEPISVRAEPISVRAAPISVRAEPISVHAAPDSKPAELGMPTAWPVMGLARPEPVDRSKGRRVEGPLRAGRSASAGVMQRKAPVHPPIRIGVARDKAFGFYYPDDLEALQRCGAALVPFDTLNDPELPAVDGLFIGGGFPEMFMDELQANTRLRARIAAAVEAGLPVYAECGGLMYLARSLSWQGRTCRMVGAIQADALMHERPVGRGYVELEPTTRVLWTDAAPGTTRTLRGHEFHYSSLENLDPKTRFAYKVLRGHGVDGHHDGIVVHNLLASYSHLRCVDGAGWAQGFAAFVRSCKSLALRAPAGAPARDEPAEAAFAA